ncbi:MAG: energy-coupling factor transporter transmembrane component T [Sulfolobales archaeon]
MFRRPLSSTLFIYALVISLLAFIARDTREMLMPGLLNMIAGFALGFRRFRPLILLFLAGVVGLVLNSLLVANTGKTVLSIDSFLIIRENAVRAVINITLRLGMIAGATLVFLSISDPRNVIRDLERDLRLPRGIVFAIFYALRLYQLLKKDLDEIMLVRAERGFRRISILPRDILTLITPLLSVGIERAMWAGVSAEMRGLAIRSVKYPSRKISHTDYMIYVAMILQIAYVLIPTFSLP